MNRSREDLTFNIDEIDCAVCGTTMIWSDETRDWTCPECGNTAYQTYDCASDEIYYEHGPHDDYGEYYDE